MSKSPAPDLDRGLVDVERKQQVVDWVFDRVADRYDLGNHIMSLGMHRVWKARLVRKARIQPDHRVLDLACGTGDVSFAVGRLAHRGEVIGTDINPHMMRVAEAKRPPGCDHVRFLEADASELPFEDGRFDRVTCSYAGRGFPDWPAVTREVYRVLAPGGQFLNLDFARPPVGWVDRAYRGWLLYSGALLGQVLHGDPATYRYIPKSMATYPGQRWLERQLRAAGFDAHTEETLLWLMAYNHGIKPI